ncbi:hypothetical protein ACH50O_12310 [Methylomonas sp. 2BW1-5-20]|uniref:hypothetical protein n=1 Tax=Methylomonas sp. 2BW1-5-20 TaxID=3376686 RepID=UPI00404BCFE4
MNEQWPSERHSEKREIFADSSFKTAQDFLSLLNALPLGLPKAFDDIVSWIVEQDGDLSELEQRTAQLADEIAPTIPDSKTMLMTLACAAALAHSPLLQTWNKVNAFKYNSWQLEHWLGEAMTAYAELTSSLSDAYVTLAKKAFVALDNFTLESKSSRVNDERAGAWGYWNERQDKLEEIWWGLRGWHGFMNYEEELPLFQMFYKLNPDEFFRTITSSSNPYLVSSLLFVAGIGAFSPCFSEWKRTVSAAPVAFSEDGKWNGSVMMPLLLVEARNQLLQTGRDAMAPNFTPSKLDEIKQEITSTAELIVTALAARQDAPSIFARWTPWLMQHIIGHTSREIQDVKSSAFADDALIDVIGHKLEDRTLPQTSPEDAPTWEAWCYRCVLASFAYNGHIPILAWEDFGNQWRLSPEDWASNKGSLLREHASLIVTLNKETPGVSANLLAYPIAQSASPTEAWIGLWNDTIALREIVEFGDSDAIEDEYSSRSEAGRLLLLLFRIGLAIFDQAAASTYDNKSPEARTLACLFNALNCATHEMREIDSTLNHDEWLSVVQHLAVRRIIWESPAGTESASGNFQVFKSSDTPTVSNILADAKGNVVELASILQSLLFNNPDVSRLKDDLNLASIDVSNIVHTLRTLNQYHPRKYPVDEAQLQKLGELI